LYRKYGIPFHVIYLALEESEDEFLDNLAVSIMNDKYGFDIDFLKVNSFKRIVLTDKEMEVYEQVMLTDVAEIMKHVTVVDSQYNPTGNYKAVIDIANNHLGESIYKKVTYGEGEEQRTVDKFVEFKLKDPKMNVIVVMDHQQLLQGEYDNTNKKHLDQRGAITRWCTYYCKNWLTKNYGFTVLNVGQEAFAAQDLNHFKADKLEPSLDSLGDNKLILRDSATVLALYKPHKHKLREHGGYNLNILGDKYTSLHILKSRFGTPARATCLYFDGKSGLFNELPNVGSTELNNLYKKLTG